MSGNNINIDVKKITKSDFYDKNKKIFYIDDIDVNKILVSKKESYGKKNLLKYFIGYNDKDAIRSLFIKLPKMTSYVRKFDENGTMSSRVNDKQLFKNYIEIWEKIEELMKIDFESKPVYDYDNDKYIKIRIKIYADSKITNFYTKKILKEKAPGKCLSIIMVDSRFCY